MVQQCRKCRILSLQRQQIANLLYAILLSTLSRQPLCSLVPDPLFLTFPLLKHLKRHLGLDIITMEQFLKREALTGKLRDRKGKVVFPPQNRTDWSGKSQAIFKWLRKVSYVALWNPDDCMAAFPATTSSKDVQDLHAMSDAVAADPPSWSRYVGKPTPVGTSLF